MPPKSRFPTLVSAVSWMNLTLLVNAGSNAKPPRFGVALRSWISFRKLAFSGAVMGKSCRGMNVYSISESGLSGSLFPKLLFSIRPRK